MATQLPVSLVITSDSRQAKDDLTALRKELDGAGSSAKGAGTQATGLGDALSKITPPDPSVSGGLTDLAGAASKAAKETKTAADDLTALRKELDGAGSSAKGAGTQATGLGDALGKITPPDPSVSGGLTDLAGAAQEAAQGTETAAQGAAVLRGSSGGLLNVLGPLSLGLQSVAAVAVVLFKAWQDASAIATGLANSIVLSGNAAGTTQAQLEQLTEAIGEQTGRTAEAAQALTVLVGSGKVAQGQLGELAEASVLMSQAIGISVQEAAAQFVRMGEDPVRAVGELNDSYGILTASIYQQAQALVDRGEKEQAAELVQSAAAAAFKERAAAAIANANAIERAMDSLRSMALQAWSAIGQALNGATQAQKRETLDNDLASAKQQAARGGYWARLYGPQVARLQAQQGAMQNDDILARRAATVQAEQQAAQKAGIEGAQLVNKWIAAGKSQSERRADERKKLLGAAADLRAAGGQVDAAKLRQGLAAIDDKFKDPKAKGGGGGSGGRAARAGGRSGGNTVFQSARAEATEALAGLRANLQVLQSTLRAQDDAIEAGLKRGSVSLQDAYDQRLGLITQQAVAERQALEQQRAEIDKALASARTPQERSGLASRRVQIEAQLKVLDTSVTESTRKLREWRDQQQKELDALSVKLRVDVSGLTGVVDPDAIAAQVRASLADERQALGRLPAADQAGTARRLDIIEQAGIAQAQFNATLAETQRISDALQVQEARISQQRESGAISAAEAEVRIAQARADTAPALAAIIDQLQRIKGAVPPEAQAVLDKMAAGIGGLRVQADAALPAVGDGFRKVASAGVDSLVQQLGNVDTAFQSIEKTAASVLKAVANQILQSGVREALTAVFSAGGGGGGGGGSGIIGTLFAAGRAAFGFAEGGHIRGPGTGTSDSIPALVGGVRPIAVSDGEYIHPTRAVKHYGLAFMEAVRTLRLPKPRFAFGGLATAHAQARFATGGQARSSGSSSGTGASGGAGAMPANVSVQLINQGTPQRATASVEQQGRDMVVKVVLADLNVNGPIARGLSAVRARG